MDVDDVQNAFDQDDEPLEAATEQSALDEQMPPDLVEAASAASAAPSALPRTHGRRRSLLTTMFSGWASVAVHAAILSAAWWCGVAGGRIHIALQGGTGDGTLGGGDPGGAVSATLVERPEEPAEPSDMLAEFSADRPRFSSPAEKMKPPEIDQDFPPLQAQRAIPDADLADAGMIGLSGGTGTPLFRPPQRTFAIQPRADASGAGMSAQPPRTLALASNGSQAFGQGDGTGAGGDGYAPGPSGSGIRVRYPRDALRDRIEGAVLVHFQVSADGTVQSADVRQSSGHRSLDDAALDAIRQHRFARVVEGGLAVAWESTLRINFTLR